jgi:hypothetical protein
MVFLRITAFLCCSLCWLACSQVAWGAQVASGALSACSQHLVLLDAQNKAVLRLVFPDGARFGIRFIHSVAKSPVIDWFTARQGVLQLESTVYQDFGAGLPHSPEQGQSMEQRNGHVIISGYSMALPRFDVRVGRVAQHTLLLPETWEAIPLDTLAAPGAALTFTLEPQKGK